MEKMKETFEILWNEYFCEDCGVISTPEEKRVSKRIYKMYKDATSILNEEQRNAVEKYTEVIYELESILLKKAFFKGCEFSVSFLFYTLDKKSES